MKGVILAGGTGSRLRPLTNVTNKHLLPVGNKPMIFHPIEKIIEAGVEEILIVTGVEHMGDMITLLGSGKNFKCEFTYKVQDKAGGIAEALGLAEEFAKYDDSLVVLGDNIFDDNLSKFELKTNEPCVFLKEVGDPERFGVAEIDSQKKKIISIEEKPSKPKTKWAVTGIYYYNPEVYEITKFLKPSKRNELEITDVNNAYAKRGELNYHILNGWWSDAGTFQSYRAANLLSKE